MSEQGIGTEIVTQIAIVVKDMDKAIEAWSRVFGMPKPNIIITDPVEAHAVYRGNPLSSRAKLAFYKLGQVSLELIEPMDGASVWMEGLAGGKEMAFHHIAFNIKGTGNVTEYLAGHDIPVIQQGHYTGGMYTYVDSAPVLGVMLELLENF